MVAWPDFSSRGALIPWMSLWNASTRARHASIVALFHFGADPVTQDLPLVRTTTAGKPSKRGSKRANRSFNFIASKFARNRRSTCKKRSSSLPPTSSAGRPIGWSKGQSLCQEALNCEPNGHQEAGTSCGSHFRRSILVFRWLVVNVQPTQCLCWQGTQVTWRWPSTATTDAKK